MAEGSNGSEGCTFMVPTTIRDEFAHTYSLQNLWNVGNWPSHAFGAIVEFTIINTEAPRAVWLFMPRRLGSSPSLVRVGSGLVGASCPLGLRFPRVLIPT